MDPIEIFTVQVVYLWRDDIFKIHMEDGMECNGIAVYEFDSW